MEPEKDRSKAWAEFRGTDQRGAERGILAGTSGGRVWVWSGWRLHSYIADQYTIYSWFDGCSDEVRAKLNAGKANVIERLLFHDMQQWMGQARVGDYVAVYKARPENGGVEGNLREIYAYNFWLFMGKGIDTECAK